MIEAPRGDNSTAHTTRVMDGRAVRGHELPPLEPDAPSGLP